MKAIQPKPLIGIVGSSDVASAARVMAKKDVGALGVYSSDGYELVGILTERDVTRCVADGRAPEEVAVEDVMSSPPWGANGPITSEEAALLMSVGKVRHLIVQEGDRHRMISIRDLL